MTHELRCFRLGLRDLHCGGKTDVVDPGTAGSGRRYGNAAPPRKPDAPDFPVVVHPGGVGDTEESHLAALTRLEDEVFTTTRALRVNDDSNRLRHGEKGVASNDRVVR